MNDGGLVKLLLELGANVHANVCLPPYCEQANFANLAILATSEEPGQFSPNSETRTDSGLNINDDLINAPFHKTPQNLFPLPDSNHFPHSEHTPLLQLPHTANAMLERTYSLPD